MARCSFYPPRPSAARREGVMFERTSEVFDFGSRHVLDFGSRRLGKSFQTDPGNGKKLYQSSSHAPMYRGESHLPGRSAMATGTMNGVLRRLREVVHAPDTTDGQLLEHYLARRDETAFEALLRRHGPMVLGVCRRVLRHEQDAEDAFQATFVVFARKATTIWPRDMVANWLFGVAYRTALGAKTAIARRRLKERQVNPMRPTDDSASHLWHDLQPLLDEELNHLPNKYRVPIVLCDLEGKSRQEAARQLGWLPGTLSGRLARARGMLAKRLTRRGITVSGGVLAAALGQNLASASVPPSLLAGTVK